MGIDHDSTRNVWSNRVCAIFKTKDLIIYENFPDNEKERIDVVFYLKIKQIRVYYVENDEDVFIDMTLLKAINKQCEELGWLWWIYIKKI